MDPGASKAATKADHELVPEDFMNYFVSAIYPDVPSARRAADDLANNGFTHDQISVMAKEEHRDALRGTAGTTTTRTGNKAGEGAAAGGVLGAIAGGLIALASLAIPGGIIVAGPIGALLGGAAVGAAGAGLVGALIGMGIPEERAKEYDKHIRKGGILVAVETTDAARAQAAERLMKNTSPTTAPHTSNFRGTVTS